MGVDYSARCGIGVTMDYAAVHSLLMDSKITDNRNLNDVADKESYIEEVGLEYAWDNTPQGRYSRLQELGESTYTGEDAEYLLSVKITKEMLNGDGASLLARIELLRSYLEGLGLGECKLEEVCELYVS